MNLSILAIGCWVVLAFVMQSIPSNDNHWRRAYVLVAIGLPVLVWVSWRSGPWMGAFGLLVGGLILRWPVIYLFRWLRKQIGSRDG